jgi:hypothetical protein
VKENPVALTTTAQLVTYARSLGITADDLDEEILDLAHAIASGNVNDGEPYELEHKDADERAAQINEGGLETQIAYIVDTWDAATARAAIDKVGPPADSPLRVVVRAAA